MGNFGVPWPWSVCVLRPPALLALLALLANRRDVQWVWVAGREEAAADGRRCPGEIEGETGSGKRTEGCRKYRSRQQRTKWQLAEQGDDRRKEEEKQKQKKMNEAVPQVADRTDVPWRVTDDGQGGVLGAREKWHARVRGTARC
ncbi:uncharacterized protein SPSK_08078 [Sporothrix schenckii 1099-18]|uniref:Secreted protein n=1 Tax=Sporothrix schenckii 1099-18 TaxID=1397361 RepID=A0A0F2MI57_SPOSC|nr:uncharacterized protein SPSK_08078 [Sporothrix schenckii 1099-18]KJR88515.1 hypothetical protein SPSK_08078 [Sporothrix schenckii 1099-18]